MQIKLPANHNSNLPRSKRAKKQEQEHKSSVFIKAREKKCLPVEVQNVCIFSFSLLEKVAPDFTVNHTEQ